MKPQMHTDEIAMLRGFMLEADSYFEFGMGGSTVLAAANVKKRIHAVDTSQEWVDGVGQKIGAPSGKDISLRLIDVGATGGWGTPTSRKDEHKFPAYSQAILDTGYRDYDLCLVDGRFRVACFLQALDHLPAGSIVAIHDYASRPEYHLIERYARAISSVNQLKFFVKRRDCNPHELRQDLESYRLNWA